MRLMTFPRLVVLRKITSHRSGLTMWMFLAISLILPNQGSIFLDQSFGINTESITSNHNNLSVILMIGDGMGFEHVKLAQWVEKGVNGTLSMQELPIQGEVQTRNIENTITDSAASGTAMATGYKTYNGILSFTLTNVELPSILELSQQLNKSTGVVTTTEVTHATPASFYSHVLSRNDEITIAHQLVTSGVNVVMGGGRNIFITYQQELQAKGYTIVNNRSELHSVTGDKVFGLFTDDALPYEQYRDNNTIPSLSEMTNKSLELLSQDEDGFFLMVEGGQIDWANHANNGVNTALETIEFDKAVRTAIEFVNTHDNAILIVTADHETGGLTLTSESLTTPLPAENNLEEYNDELRINRTREISLSWSTGGHSLANVPIFAWGESLTAISNTTIDNTQIYALMKNFILPDDRGKPAITIVYPENKTYNISRITLSISSNESLPWVVYSLNNGPNVTVPLLIKSFTFLADGSHLIKIYGNDTMGNMGSTEVYFTIKTSFDESSSTLVSSTTSSTSTTSTTPTTSIGLTWIFPILLFPILIIRKKRKSL
ncbi:MAG: alkaline phosphatase [Candidatus Heimdallarchaeota archaeon]|nr:MAG: alkaline phosphatase [Candidatus Heimdallarchaeota archaeon]